MPAYFAHSANHLKAEKALIFEEDNMQTAIVRHILVKDKDLAEQLKRSYKVVLTLPNLPSNTPPVIRQNVVVNLVKSKRAIGACH